MKFPVLRFLMIFILIRILHLKAHAQSTSSLMGARAIGSANATSTLGDEWSLFNNVGGLAHVRNPTGAFAYEIRPAWEGANRLAAAMALPFQWGTAGMGVFRFGDDLYSEQTLSGAFSNQMGIASLGLKVNYTQYRAEGYGVQNTLSVHFGGICELTPRIAVGAYITNLNQPKRSSAQSDLLPARLTAGVSFRPTDLVRLFAEVDKDLEYPATVKGAFEYQVYKKIFFRTGFNLHPNAAFLGWGFIKKQIKVDYGMKYNSIAGIVCQASASYQWNKKKKTNEK